MRLKERETEGHEDREQGDKEPWLWRTMKQKIRRSKV